MKRRLVVLANSWCRAGGLEIVTQDIVSVFRGFGYNVVVLTARGHEQNLQEENLTVFNYEPKNRLLRSIWFRWWRYVWLGKKASAFLREGDILLVAHAHLLPALKYMRIPSGVIRWLWTHGIDAWGDDAKRIAKFGKFLTRVIAVSHYTATEEKKQGVAVPITVIPNSIDTGKFIPDMDTERVRKNEILISSRIMKGSKNKGHDVLFQAIPLIEKKLGFQVKVRVIGSGDNLEGLKILAEKICPGKVEFCGRVSDAALLEAYQHCACFCMPSRVEYDAKTKSWRGDGFGLVYAEVQACGRPVVGSTEGGAVEPILEGETGFKVNPRDVEAVADAVVKLLSSPELADRMGKAARNFVVDNFSREMFVKRINESVEFDIGNLKKRAV